MAITEHAPYAASAAVIKVLEAFRDTGLGGSPLTTPLLQRLGLGDEVARRTVHSLVLLELVDEEGKPTTNLIAFRQASSDTYHQVLADHLYDVYSSVFAITGNNLGDKTAVQIEDAFRNFQPGSLRKRMSTLFLGLCKYAGIVESIPTTKPGPKPGGPKNPPAKKAAAAKKVAADPPPPPPPLTDARQRYLEMLIAKAESQDVPEGELLDRIERALGIAPTGGSS